MPATPHAVRRTLDVLVAFAALAATPPLAAAGLMVDVVPNFFGLGVGSTTEWMGSADQVVGVVPAARVQLGKHRFAELYGPFGDVNVLDIPNWEFGPMLSYRFGRKDVEDPVVNSLPPIDGGLEAGVFGGYHHVNAEGIPWRLRVGVSATTAISGGATGGQVTPYASFWMPLSSTVFVGVGTGFTWSSDSFMRQRFDVTPGAAAVSGLPVYAAGAGVRQFYAWPAVVVRLRPRWFAGAGAFYQRLTGDAADSPIVTQRGDRNQWTLGGGIAYTWR
jgi:outer membrane protein